MSFNNKLLWYLAISLLTIVALVVGTGYLVWQPMGPAEKEALFKTIHANSGYLFILVFLLFTIAGFVFDAFIHLYLLPLRKLSEETRLIGAVNPSHRISIEGSKDINQLVSHINQMAEQLEGAVQEMKEKVSRLSIEAEQEKNVLAAIMAELPEGVVVCNLDGSVLLFNRRSKEMLLSAEMPVPKDYKALAHPSAASGFVGLGRSIYKLIEKHLIQFALAEIQDKLRLKESNVVSYFVVSNRSDQLLRVEMAPILDPTQQLTGFVLILNDITEQLAADQSVGQILDEMSKGMRGPLASIRSTIETIINYPQMDGQNLSRFRKIIHDETIALSSIAERPAEEHKKHLDTQWPLVHLKAGDLLGRIKKRGAIRLNLVIDIEAYDQELIVPVDSYSFGLSVLFVLEKIQSMTGCGDFRCRLFFKSSQCHLDFQWTGGSIKIEHLRNWSGDLLSVGPEKLPLTLQEVLGHHNAEIWPFTPADSEDQSCVRFFLPHGRKVTTESIRNITVLPQSRPEFYDFDLFKTIGRNTRFEQRLLTDLTYTVFDTETTGLNPAGGDEIISIAAVRIVNGRLLTEELYDQLVDPQRTIPKQSIAFHGILPDMVHGQPTIDKALPVFFRFAEDTVLVAHNAAFDMRMLELKQESTGIVFDQPVLDTMLLSALVHTSDQEHSLEAIAARLGVKIHDRHTAKGDALVTAEIFLKMLPLLESKQIVTLAEALTASKKVFLSKIRYK